MRRLAALTAAAFFVLARAALAAEPAKEGMPQLDFGNPLTVAQVVWGALIFYVLYLLLSRWALPQVSDVLELRAATITSDLEAARRTKESADDAVAEMTEATRKAHASAQAEISTAVAAAKDAAAQQAASQNAILDAQLAEAEKRISAARESAVGALHEVAAETATAVVTRLTGFAPDRDRVDAAVGSALSARAA
jgi:F-type H+-transporting ATPase subunit b